MIPGAMYSFRNYVCPTHLAANAGRLGPRWRVVAALGGGGKRREVGSDKKEKVGGRRWKEKVDLGHLLQIRWFKNSECEESFQCEVDNVEENGATTFSSPPGAVCTCINNMIISR